MVYAASEDQTYIAEGTRVIPALSLTRFDPSPFKFPRASVPLLPSLSWAALTLRTRQTRALDIDSRATNYTRGRYALHQAYRQAGVGPARRLLAPAYHCRTMLDPAMALQAPIGLYPLTIDLQPDLAQLADLLADPSQPVAAVLLTHYFGIEQPARTLAAVAALCKARGALLIEDCSHLCLDAVPPSPSLVGRTGSMCVSSPYKFFPSEDGGLLWRNGPAAQTPLVSPRPQPWQAQAKSWARLVRALVFKRRPSQLSPLPETPMDKRLRSPLTVDAPTDQVTQETRPSALYNAALIGVQSSPASRWVARHTDVAAMALARRSNFQQWLISTAHLPHCRPLVSALLTDTAPYMFPLRIDHPAAHFIALKQLGMPIWRWDEMAISNCKVAADYREHMLHLPCHQALSVAQMEWMIDVLSWVLKNISVGTTSSAMT